MSLCVHVLGREVATLEALGDFKSAMTYRDGVASEDFVSLTMHVRRTPYLWDDVLHPIFQMNLPEGYLLQVLQEQFGPHIGASPMALLAVIGRNMIGRVQVAPAGAKLDEPAKPVDVAGLLQGDNSEAAFTELVRAHATSGVSGVVPKFLDSDAQMNQTGAHTKTTLLTHRYIIKGSSRLLPFAALNEHLCMQVARQVMPAAMTEVSQDGQALVVHRFDVDETGAHHWGMEDFCVLLGLRPAAKYETTWERIATAVRDHVPVTTRPVVFRQMATLLLLTYALRNADCHAKNVALRYSQRDDVHLAPAYDMITTAAYPAYANNPPGIALMGRKTWAPGKSLQTFITATFGLPPRDQADIVDQISTAIAEVAPQVRQMMVEHPAFAEIGKRMLFSWREGIAGLRDKRTYALGETVLGDAFQGLSDPKPVNAEPRVVGRSDLLGRR
ncbi:MAG: type II toxin-antitoxin system HipA family toxin [Xanthomonadaceae bacterium]|nr:type II toxin-antitoxin system HipA family toxin [Xanthomonadaceae bacterium]MDP2186425.1 type II toxin-antitoxin system HipA family toxin [Xanthomonadales bacterium]MDZ4115463.1 type II toxin-antitoxin system HipA family toxin [Xanthomonadaceae bacterium]MDZ4376956.1 type II toxin-antitoxin system HipA family toxin [Xanthomonadaceae bacterium]